MSFMVGTEKEKSPEPTVSLIMSLPDDIILDIVARVPRCFYPTISLVSRSFRSLVTSHELYTRRSLLGCMEHLLYVVLYNYDTRDHRLYILRRKVKPDGNNRLVIIRSLPPMPSGASYVTVGSKIYVMGGSHHGLDTRRNNLKSVLSIDCRYDHTVHPISDIPNHMAETVACMVDEKIYLIGDCLCDDKVSGSGWWKRVMVLDIKTQMWEPDMTKPDMELGNIGRDVVVMEDKIYMKNCDNSFGFGPKESKWELNHVLNSRSWVDACVVDDVLYYFGVCNNQLKAYDPKHRRWRVVKGLEKLLRKTTRSSWSKTVSYGGKMALFFNKYHSYRQREILCAEIAFERRQGGEIFGKVQWSDVVFDDGRFTMIKCLAVTI